MILLLTLVTLGSLILLLLHSWRARYKKSLLSAYWHEQVTWAFLFSLIVWTILSCGIESAITLALVVSAFAYGYHRWRRGAQTGTFLATLSGFFVPLLVVWVIRYFIIQPYQVPTGSLEPTVLPGDVLIVNQFKYALRMPVFHHRLVTLSTPQRGDIVLFNYPKNPSVVYVKRLIGLPGDHIVYHHKTLMINGEIIPQTYLHPATTYEPNSFGYPVNEFEENLLGIRHRIYISPTVKQFDDVDVVVPKDHYFMMGDNRDYSYDSRFWGFVPADNLIGSPMIIVFSYDINAWNQGHWLPFRSGRHLRWVS